MINSTSASTISEENKSAGEYHLFTDFNNTAQIKNALVLLENAMSSIYTPDKSFYCLESIVGSFTLSNGLDAYMYGLDNEAFSMEVVTIKSGKLPTEKNVICIEERILHLLPDIKLNDSIEFDLTLTTGEIIKDDFVLVGIIEDMKSRSRYFGEYSTIYTTIDTTKSLYNAYSAGYNEKLLGIISKDKNYAIDIATQELFQYIKNETGVSFFINSKYHYVRDLSSINQGLILIISVICIISIVVIIGIFNINLEYRKKQFYLLRCIGITGFKLCGLVIIEAALLSAIGATLGIVVGCGISFLLLKSIIEGIFSTGVIIQIDSDIMIFIALLSGLVGIASALVPAIKLAKGKPYMINKNIRRLPSITFKNAKLPLYLAIKYVADKGKLFIYVSLIISMCLSMFTIFFYNNIDRKNNFHIYNGNYELSLKSFNDSYTINESLTEDDMQKIKSIDGIDFAYGYFQYDTTVNFNFGDIFTDNETETNKVFLNDYYTQYEAYNGIYTNGVSVFACDDYFLGNTEQLKNSLSCETRPHIYESFTATEFFANGEPKSVNHVIENIPSFSYKTTNSDVTLVNIGSTQKNVMNNLRHTNIFGIFMSNEQFFGSQSKQYTNIIVFTNKLANKAHVEEELFKIIMSKQTCEIFNLDDMNSQNKQTINQLSFVFFIVSLVIYAGMLVNVYNTVSLAIFSRLKSLTILRVIGMDYADIKKMFFYEAIFVGVISSLLGIVIGFFTTMFISQKIQETTFESFLLNAPWFGFISLFIVNILFCIFVFQICLHNKRFIIQNVVQTKKS